MLLALTQRWEEREACSVSVEETRPWWTKENPLSVPAGFLGWACVSFSIVHTVAQVQSLRL